MSAVVKSRARLSRSISFSSAYAYARAGETYATSVETYGRFAAPDGLGCNFRAEVVFEGDVEPMTGMCVDLADVDAWLKAAASQFDHYDLTKQPAFAGKPATADAIARAFHLAVKNEMPSSCPARLIKTRLYEGAQAWADFF